MNSLTVMKRLIKCFVNCGTLLQNLFITGPLVSWFKARLLSVGSYSLGSIREKSAMSEAIIV